VNEPSEPVIRLGWERAGERTLGHRVANECAIAEALHVARQILGARIAPVGVAFRHEAPASIAAHVAFFDVRPRFGSSWEGLGVFYEIRIWRGLFIQPSLRWWPTVASTFKNGSTLRSADGTSVTMDSTRVGRVPQRQPRLGVLKGRLERARVGVD
jgi:hypothetical protein